MTNLSDEAISIIKRIIDLMKQDAADLDDKESIVDLLEGEFEENYPHIEISRSEIRSYLDSVL